LVLFLGSAGFTTTNEGRGWGIIDLLFSVSSDHERWDVDQILADSDMSLFNQDSSVMDRSGVHVVSEDDSLKSSFHELGDGETQDIIELVFTFVEETQSETSSQEGSTFEYSSFVVFVKSYNNSSRTSVVPRRPFEKERLDNELQIIGKYGLKNKREVWRVQLTLARLRKAARELLTLDEHDERRVFEGAALMRRCFRLGLLNESENKLDYILGLTIPKFMERRIQTVILRNNMNTRSIHHARVLVKQRHIRVGKNLVNVPSFMVRVDREKQIDYASTSPFVNGGKPGRTKRKNNRNAKKEVEE